MGTISESVTIEASAEVAYEQWNDYESLPRITEGVVRVQRRGGEVTHWTVSVAGVTREFDAEVCERVPGRRLAWRSVGGPEHSGAVEFEPLGEGGTRVTARLEVVPRGFAETAAERLGVLDARVREDLEQFKRYLEDGCARADEDDLGIWPERPRQQA